MPTFHLKFKSVNKFWDGRDQGIGFWEITAGKLYYLAVSTAETLLVCFLLCWSWHLRENFWVMKCLLTKRILDVTIPFNSASLSGKAVLNQCLTFRNVCWMFALMPFALSLFFVLLWSLVDLNFAKSLISSNDWMRVFVSFRRGMGVFLFLPCNTRTILIVI